MKTKKDAAIVVDALRAAADCAKEIEHALERSARDRSWRRAGVGVALEMARELHRSLLTLDDLVEEPAAN